MFDKKENGRWWDFGWQLVEGCTKCSPGCDNCWSLAKEHRLNIPKEVIFHEERLQRPIKRKKPTSYAIWNDLFHEDISFTSILKVYDVIAQARQHVFFILTKRPERILEFFKWLGGLALDDGFDSMPSGSNDPLDYCGHLPNLILGVTAENQEQADKRIPVLLEIPAVKWFVSCEPLLSNIDFNIKVCKNLTYNYLKGEAKSSGEYYGGGNKLSWVICGPETGAVKRPMKREWIESLYHQCKAANVPFFDKKDVLGLGLKQMPI